MRRLDERKVLAAAVELSNPGTPRVQTMDPQQGDRKTARERFPRTFFPKYPNATAKTC